MIKYLTAGESHGPELTGIIEGIPAGFEIRKDQIDKILTKRQLKTGAGGRMNVEKDEVLITAGIVNGLTTGGPIAITIRNKDWENWKDKDIDPYLVPRPGHADFAGTVKYNHSDIRHVLERASARETAMRTALGSICLLILRDLEINLFGYVASIGSKSCGDLDFSDLEKLRNVQESSSTMCPNKESDIEFQNEIKIARKKKDTLGGSISVVAKGLPVGLGSYVHYDRKIDGRIASAFMSVQSVKAVSIGNGLDAYKSFGTEFHDEIILENKELVRSTNNSGGIEGGMTTGEDLIATAYLKPISTTLTPLQSVDLSTKEQVETVYERSDTCSVPRAVPIFESILAIEILKCLLEKTGGDNKKEISASKESLPGKSIDDFDMETEKWNLDYDI